MTGVTFSLFFQFMHFDKMNLKITANKKFCSLMLKNGLGKSQILSDINYKSKCVCRPCVVVCLKHEMLKTGTYQFL